MRALLSSLLVLHLGGLHACMALAFTVGLQAQTRNRAFTGAQRCTMQDPALLFNFFAGGVAGTVASVATQVWFFACT